MRVFGRDIILIDVNVQFIPAQGEPQWAVIPYAEYLKLKAGLAHDSSRVKALPEMTLSSGTSPLRAYRKARGLSQAELAARAGISVPYLCQLEKGIRSGTHTVIKSLAQALEIEVGMLFGGN